MDTNRILKENEIEANRVLTRSKSCPDTNSSSHPEHSCDNMDPF